MVKKSKTACKPGKAPVGKNGRCVKTNRCKVGKIPAGKNGRCVKPKTLKVRKSRRMMPSPIQAASPVMASPTPSPVKAAPVMRSSTNLEHDEINRIIEEYMEELDDPTFFTNEEIEKFIDISIKKKLDRETIRTALDDYSKDLGEFA